MAPVEFEKNIAEKLHNREIKPSEKAWETLASRLETTSPAGKGKVLKPWMYAVAAGLLLLIGLYQGFKEDPLIQEFPDTVPVVAVPKSTTKSQPINEGSAVEADQVQTDQPIPAHPTPEAGLAVAEGSAETDGTQTDIALSTPTNTIADQREDAVAEKAIALADAQDPNRGTAMESFSLENKISTQVDAVIAQVTALESQGVQVTDAEIDAMLREAQESIPEAALVSNKDGIDAMALLEQAEIELDRSYREEIFDKLKKGFNKVRLAMVRKND